MSDHFFYDGVRFLSAGSAAASFKRNPDYVARLARTGKVHAKRIGKQWYVSERALKDFLVQKDREGAKRRNELKHDRRREYVQRKRVMHIDAPELISEKRGEAVPLQQVFSESPLVKLAQLPVPTAQSTYAAHAYVVHPLLDFVHRAAALITAVVLVFGTYAFVDPHQVSALAAQVRSIANEVRSIGLHNVVSSGDLRMLSVAASAPSGDIIERISRSWNYFVDDTIAGLMVPYDRVPRMQRSQVTVSVTPRDRPVSRVTTPAVVRQVNPYVIERVTTSALGGVSEQMLAARMAKLELSLMERINNLSLATAYSNNRSIENIGNQTYIGDLTSIDIFTSTFTGGTITNSSITGGSISGVTLDISDLSGVVSVENGGTGTSTYDVGDLLYADAANSLTTLPVGSNGQVLKVVGGTISWAADLSGGAGGGGVWATTTDDLAIYPTNTSYTVLVGTNATSTTGTMLEVNGSALFRGTLTGYGTLTAPRFIATSSVASTFPYASTTALSATTLCLSADCRTTWPTDGFSTTSATYFASLGLAWSTTSAEYYVSQANLSGFSTTSADFWQTQRNFFSTTSADYFLAQNQGAAFSTTSATNFANLGLAFSTTSNEYWKSVNNFFSTTSAQYFASVTDLFSTTSANYFVSSSTTIPKTYTANVFTGSNTFAGVTASSLTLGALNGPLQANNGVVSATTSIGVLYGGTGLTAAPGYGQVLLGQSDGTYQLVATSSLGITSGSGNSFEYPFPDNATTTLLSFNGGLIANASSSITALSTITSTSTNATSTNLFATNARFTNATTSNLAISGLTSSLLATNAQGSVIATTTLSTNYLVGALGTINGTTFNAGSSIIITAASSTLLADANTFSGSNTFSSLITGSISGNAGTATALQTARNINGVSFNGTADITITAASSTLLANNNTFSGTNSFQNTTFTNATATSLAITGTPSALLATDSTGRVYATTSLSSLYLDTTGNWSGTFDGQEGSYYLANSFSTTSASNFAALGLAFSTTSNDYWQTQRNFFSTTSADYWGSTKGYATFGYLFPDNATTTLLSFNGGLIANASSSITALSTITSTSTNATSTNLFATNARFTNATTSNLAISGLTSSLLATNAQGSVIATTTLSTNYLVGALGTINGTTFNAGSSIIITAASSTLLADANTFSGSNTFSSLITGSISGNAGTATALQTARNINGVSFNGTADITITAASSTLLANNNTFSGTNSFQNTTFTNATATSLAITNTPSALLSTNASGSVIATTSLSSNYLSAIDKGFFFSTTSANHWSSLGLAFSTTSNDYWQTQRNFFSTTSAQYFVHSSTTIPKTYTANTFTALQTFANASSTLFSSSYASSTNLVAGNFTLGTLNGPLQANNGVVSATSSILAIYGGTGQTSYAVGDILYADTAGSLTRLPIGSAGTVLKVAGGVPTWGTDITTGGGGGAGAWSTTTDSLAVYPTDTSDVIIVGSNATATANSILEVFGRSYFSNTVGIATTAPGTLFSVGGVGNFAPTGSTLYSSLTLGSLTATSSLNVTGNTTLANATSTTFAVTGTPSALLATRADGSVYATTSLASNYLSGVDKGFFFSTTSAQYFVHSSTTIPKTYTANTFTALQTFANASSTLFSSSYASSTNLVAGNFTLNGAATLTNYVNGALAVNASGNLYTFSTTTWSFASSTLLADSNTFSGTNSFQNTTFTNATATSLAITGTPSALLATDSTGRVYATTSLSSLYLDTTGNWSGTFDGQEGSYYLANSFSTTSASNFAALGLAFSTTSNDYWQTQRNFFSTTSADYWGSTKGYATFGYLFPDNATTTLLSFNGGLIANASSSITALSTITSTSTNATSTNLFATNARFTNATTSNLAISGLTSSLLATNAQGSVIATTTLSTNYLVGALGTINGTTFNAGSSIIITAASSTLLADANTFSGSNTFSSLITGSISGNAGTATALQTARNINGVSFNGTADITITAASSTLLANNNTFSGTNSFQNTTFTNATATSLAITGTPSALLATDSTGRVYATTSLSSLYLDTTGNWSGTFDGQEGSYYLANSFSTTSASNFAALGLAFSTTSNDYWQTQRNFFSTTSAQYFVHSSTTIPKTYTANTFTALQTFANASSTLFSSSYASSTNLVAGNFTLNGAATLTNYVNGALAVNASGNLYTFSTTTWSFASSTLLADSNTFSGTNSFQNTTFTNATATSLAITNTPSALLSTNASGSVIATTSLSSNYLSAIDKGFFFSTTSANHWSSLGLAFSTTSNDYWQTQRNFFSTTSAQYFVHSSTTIPKTYTANTFTNTNTFSGQTNLTNASTTNLTVSTLASTSQLVASNSFTFSTVTGFLKATAGVVATSLINLAADVTGILPVANGGTGWGAVQAGSILYGNGASQLSTTTAGTNGQILALAGGVPTWVASTTFSSPLVYANGNVTIQDAVADGSTKGAASFTAADFNSASGVISIDYANGQEASASQDGFLSSTHWSLFNNKVSSSSLDTYASTYRDWSIQGNGYLAPTTTRGILLSASSTIFNLTTLTSTSTNATSTNLFATNAAFTRATTTSLAITNTPSALLSTNASGSVIATTSLSSNYLSAIDKGFFFSTTSANHWSSLGLAFSTTSNDYWQTQRNFFSTTSAQYFVHSSTTIPKTYTANTFTNTNTFSGQTNLTNASTTNLTVSTLASTSQLVASNSFTFSTVTGFLKATAGVVATSLINLAADVTGILPVANGGTGWGAVQAGSILYGNGASQLSTTTAGTNGQILALAGGVPTWVASTTFSSPLVYANGNVTIQDAVADGSTKGAASFTAADFNSASGVISIDYANGQEASASQDGFLSSTHWSLFNNKVSSSSLDTYASTYRDWSIQGNGYLAPTTTRGILLSASSTIFNLTTLTSTSTNATSTNLFATNAAFTRATTTSLAVSGISSGSLLKTTTGGALVAAVAGTDYAVFAYPFALTGNATSTLTQFNGGLTAYASSTIGSGTQTGGLTISGGATTTGLLTVTGTGTSTIASNLNVQGQLKVGTGSIFLNGAATSTFSHGIQSSALNITSSTASSTFANGIQLAAGCFRGSDGLCITNATVSGSGGTNRVAYWSNSSTLTSNSGFTFDGTTLTSRELLLSHTSPFLTMDDSGTSGSDFRIDVLAGSATFNADIAGTAGTAYLAFANDGTEQMRLNAAGKLGIGTTSPWGKLTVQATGGQTNPVFEVASSSNALKFLSVAGDGFGTTTLTGLTVSGSATSTSNVGWNITGGCFAVNGTCVGSGGSGTVGSGTTGQFPYYAAAGTTLTATSSLFLSTSGNVGIGTTTPGALLDLNKADNTTYNLRITNGGAAGKGILVQAGSTGSDASLLKIVNSTGATTFFEVTDGNSYFNNGNVGIGTTSPWGMLSVTNTDTGPSFIVEDSASPDSTPFVIDASGNVGIGTSTPTEALTISGGGQWGAQMSVADGLYVNPNSVGAQVTAESSGGVEGGILSYDTTGIFYMGSWSNHDVRIRSNNTDRLTIDTSGDVGIGTTSPWGTLSITNTGTGPSFIVEDSASPDSTPFVIDASGNVGIGDTSPASLLTVGSGDLFQVNSSGAIAAATGITSSGTITFSGLTADRLVTTTTGGALTTSISSSNLAASITDETGTGSAVFSASPTFTGTVNAAAATLSSTLTMSGSAANIALGSNYLSGDGGDEGIYVGSTGFVGIATTTPISLLNIASAGSATTIAGSSIHLGAVVNPVSQRSGFTVWQNSNSFLSSTDGNAAFGFVHPWNASDASAAFKVFRITTGTESGTSNTAATTMTDRFYVRKDGGAYFENAVGIGMTTPAAKLAVSGGNIVLMGNYASSSDVLLHMDGTDAATTFPDVGIAGRTWTAGGNAQVDTAQRKFGGAAALFDNTNDYLVSASSQGDYTLAENFTLDMWVYPNSLASDDSIIRMIDTTDSNEQVVLYIDDASGGVTFATTIGGATVTSITCSAMVTTGSWQHIAVVRNGNTVTMYDNGTSCGTDTSSGGAIRMSTMEAYIGNDSTLATDYDGWIDELRLTRTALWTANFTAPTAAGDSTLSTAGHLGIGTSSPRYPITHESGANLSIGGTWTNASDRNLKENFTSVDFQTILGQIDSLDVSTWNYKKEGAGTIHLGPMAQDFYAQFGLGDSETSISTIDASGVALAGIKGLSNRLSALSDYLGVDMNTLVASYLATTTATTTAATASSTAATASSTAPTTTVTTASSTASTTESMPSSGIFAGFFTKIATWLSETANGILKIVTDTLQARRVVTDELCTTTSEGEERCVNGDQLAALLAGQSIVSSQTSTNTSGGAIEIVIQGDNPVTIEAGTSYADLGAVASTSVASYINLPVHTYQWMPEMQDFVKVATVALDTDVVGSTTIRYRVIDAQGAVVAEADRNIQIEAPTTENAVTDDSEVPSTENSQATPSEGLEGTPEDDGDSSDNVLSELASTTPAVVNDGADTTETSAVEGTDVATGTQESETVTPESSGQSSGVDESAPETSGVSDSVESVGEANGETLPTTP